MCSCRRWIYNADTQIIKHCLREISSNRWRGREKWPNFFFSSRLSAYSIGMEKEFREMLLLCLQRAICTLDHRNEAKIDAVRWTRVSQQPTTSTKIITISFNTARCWSLFQYFYSTLKILVFVSRCWFLRAIAPIFSPFINCSSYGSHNKQAHTHNASMSMLWFELRSSDSLLENRFIRLYVSKRNPSEACRTVWMR